MRAAGAPSAGWRPPLRALHEQRLVAVRLGGGAGHLVLVGGDRGAPAWRPLPAFWDQEVVENKEDGGLGLRWLEVCGPFLNEVHGG